MLDKRVTYVNFCHFIITFIVLVNIMQIAYTAGIPSVAKEAASVLWNFFIKAEDPEKTSSIIQTAGNDLCVTLKR